MATPDDSKASPGVPDTPHLASNHTPSGPGMKGPPPLADDGAPSNKPKPKLLSEDDRPFIERTVSNIFDGFTPLSLLKAFAPIEVLMGLGILFSAVVASLFTPKALFVLAALLLLPPLLRALAQTPDPRAPAVNYGVHMGKIEGEYCVFLLGARANNKPWIFNKQFAFVGKNFRKIMRELERLPASAGYLGGEMFTSSNMMRGSHVMAVTYWRSFEHMVKYTFDRQLSHVGAIGERDALFGDMRDCGIWHEAYRVRPGDYETVYLNCPPLHLGAASGLVPAVGPLRHISGRVKATVPGDERELEKRASG